MIQCPPAMEETAFDLLKPAGTTIGYFGPIIQMARTNRVNGFAFEKSSPNIAFIRGKYGDVQPIIANIAGRVHNSNPVKQAEGLPDKPNNNCSPRTPTFVTLPGRTFTLSNNTFAQILS